MKGCEHEQQLKARRGKSREVSSRFLSSPSASSSSPNRRNSTSNLSTKRDDQNNNGMKKHDRMSIGTQVCLGLPNQSSIEVDTKENRRPSPRIDDEGSVILPGRFSVDGCALYRASSTTNSCSLLYESLNDESDSELSDVSYSSSVSTNRSSRNHKPGIKVSSKYLRDLTARPSKGNNNETKPRSQEDLQRANSFRGIENRMKRNNSVARYGSSMSQWALSPGRSLDIQAVTVPSLKLMNNRLVQWRFVNARACAANNSVASQEKNQLLCAWDALTKLKHLFLQERIKLQKKNLEMKLNYVLLSQVKHLEAWEDMEREHISALSMTRESLHSVLSRLPLKEGAKMNIESAVTMFKTAETVTDAIISTLNSYAPTMEGGIVPLASQLAEVAAQEKLMLEQCHDLMRMITELEMQERSLKCCFMIQHKQTFDTEFG
ncbi:PREDICTED: QWRF motif-containing protein 3-like [Camelina sativa]|uniref:QWRF motif-containing protein 3-like n=1 Tax=Camelina sativa TaxID=90675 RepID=A0ABM0XSA5_CAMSA|nr:PREDICTED: QWRF motif-containing protein 3-like [Camelina sativa]